MKFGERKHISELKIGDRVRLLSGMGVDLVKVEYLKEVSKCYYSGSKAPVVGGPDDFRQGYDIVTVVDVKDNEIRFQRPHIEIYNGQKSPCNVTVSVETFTAYRDHGGLWYESL